MSGKSTNVRPNEYFLVSSFPYYIDGVLSLYSTVSSRPLKGVLYEAGILDNDHLSQTNLNHLIISPLIRIGM